MHLKLEKEKNSGKLSSTKQEHIRKKEFGE